MLELRELVKYYRAGEGELVRAVDGVTLEIAAGELLVLYGPSGSGKTTLVKMVAALLAPDSGSVIVDGREISALSEHDAASYRLYELGYVAQAFNLRAGGTVVENAASKLWLTKDVRRAERMVVPLLERLGLGERLGNLPSQLSMGERQRVTIARALSVDPKLVVADEPTGSLDTQRGEEVLELLRELCRERQIAVLLTTHDPKAAAFADKALELRDGRLGAYESEAGQAERGSRPSRASERAKPSAGSSGRDLQR
ncbi:MAG TPA: ABC transporter ATP-binding protein [Solirubrobacteraceae bacterium]